MNKTHIYPKRLGYSHLYQAHTHIYIQWRNAHLVSYCAWSERQIYQCAHTDSIQFMGLFKPLYASLSILSSSYYHGWGLLHTCSHVGATYPSAVLCSVNNVNKSNSIFFTSMAPALPMWLLFSITWCSHIGWFTLAAMVVMSVESLISQSLTDSHACINSTMLVCLSQN